MSEAIPNGPPPSTLNPDGPRVVAIGGGHGLARSLGAMRRYASSCTAIVSVADDGGSSGRLRAALGIPAPGDLRMCLSALLPEPTALGRALEYRFAGEELEGHAFGNLLLAALAATTGDFVAAVGEACRLLGTVGQVLPATSTPVVLKAEIGSGELEGQVAIMASSGISRISLVPPDPEVPPAVLEAIARAEQLIIGPGSLYTSVLAALGGRCITESIATSSATRIYVANLRDQVPETAGFDVGRHLEALLAHGVVPDVVLADTATIALGTVPSGIEVRQLPLARPDGLVHDEVLLARALSSLESDRNRRSVVAQRPATERD